MSTRIETLDCSVVVQQLWDYLDGELDAGRWESIREHLATCTGCHAHVEFCRTFLAQVAAVPMDSDEVAKLRARVLVAIRAERTP